MNIKKELNLVELASEMAETMLLNVTLQNGLKSEDIIEDFGSEEFSAYTDEAQDVYNEYYDEIYNMLCNLGFKHKD